MTADETSELSPYPDDAPVLVRFPRTRAQEQGDRSAWPWLPGTIMSRCGPDEWQVCVEAREVATAEDGTPAPDGTPDGTPEADLFYPVCFRDASEIRPDGGS